MWKAACLVLAASLIFPLLASWASPPDEAPAAAWDGPAPTLPGDTDEPVVQVMSDLKARFSPASDDDELSEEQIQELMNLHTQYLVWRHLESPAPARKSVCLAASGTGVATKGRQPGDSICDFGAAVTRMQPCLAAGDCPAAEAWRQAMGEMGVRPAPQGLTRASVRSSIRVERPEQKED